MAAASEGPGSSLTELKTLFKIAQSKPVNAAFGLGSDGKVVIKLDKMLKPKALAKALLDAKVKPVYSGIVTIDDNDSATANFEMDKQVSGVEAKLIMALKGSGVSKVNITQGGGDASGGDAGDADDGAAPPDAAAPEAAAAAPPAEPAPQAAAEPAPAQAAAAPGGPAPAALTAELTALVKQMMTVIAGNPAQKATLTQLATTAQASLKQGNLQQAQAAIANLQQALTGAASAGAAVQNGAAPGAPAADPAATQKLQKSQQIWTATRAKIDAELQKLSKAVLAAAEGEDIAQGLEQQFTSAVEPVLQTLDDSLSDALSKAAAATDPAERQKQTQQAQALIAKYQQFVAGNPIISHLDKNPFVPLAIEKTLTATITALSASVH